MREGFLDGCQRCGLYGIRAALFAGMTSMIVQFRVEVAGPLDAGVFV